MKRLTLTLRAPATYNPDQPHNVVPNALLWLGYRTTCLNQALRSGDSPALVEKHGGNVEYWLGWAGKLPLSAYPNVPRRVIAHFASKLFTGPLQQDTPQ